MGVADAQGRFVVRFRNYLPRAGVKAGANSVVLQIEEFGSARVEELRVGPDSGVFITRIGPTSLKLEPRALNGPWKPGETQRVEAVVRSLGGGVAKNVHVTLQVAGPGEASVRPLKNVVLKQVKGRKTVRWTVSANEGGRYNVKLDARSGTSHASAETTVAVLGETERRRIRWWAIGGAAILGIVAPYAWAKLRRRPTT
jgi:hypothetical protein